MARYVQSQRYPHQNPGEVQADSARYVDVPGYFGSAGEVTVGGKIPTWAMLGAIVGGLWYVGVDLPVIGKRKKKR